MSSPEPRTPTLTPLGYGAANVGNLFRAMSDDDAFAILEAAWESGIRYFDTAPHYGLGLSERRLGAFLSTKPRDEYVVSTKVGRLLRPNPDDDGGLDLDHDFHVPTTLRREWDVSADGIRTSISESLQRMGLDRIDMVYLHDPERHDLDLAVAEALPALEQLRAEGVVRAVGIGTMVADTVVRGVGAADLDVVMIAGRYTLLEQPAAAEALPACHRSRTDVVAASVFNSGLLATAQPSREGRYEYGGVPDDVWERLQRITAIAADWEVPLPAAAVQFPLRDTAVRSVVVGGSRPAHLVQNAEYMRLPVPDGFWAELADAALIPA
ncbi:MAG: aldo/keto reductase [Microbacterium sp.]|uniref:aldo/keto reductase n=1 Tax=unclassified Microbacterium TaxID=2609290 RepID=UPI000C3B602C|nr:MULTISPECIES: aldo/keto reductase [unclassified Microbacterium]MAY50275.1 aldo/keto reductase [Microbacterium sp.]HBR88601.1 aldo/keto reductase [Microbacterium sp.]HBS73109.1 aldo/keto reductase [Microbacterium sp.]|tara:strand:- start:2879 stop:3850 length:972 start_codon:yes stop_codon:yes gene_type:complete